MTGLTIKELGIKIREKRKAAGMTQADLAAFLGVTKATISKYELGLREPSFEQLQTIGEALGLGTFSLVPESMQNAFMGGVNEFLHTKRFHNAASTEEAEDAVYDAVNIFGYFDDLDEFGQKRTIACARAFAGYDPIEDDCPPHSMDIAITALCKMNDEGQRLTAKYAESLAADPVYQKENPPADPEDK